MLSIPDQVHACGAVGLERWKQVIVSIGIRTVCSLSCFEGNGMYVHGWTQREILVPNFNMDQYEIVVQTTRYQMSIFPLAKEEK